MSVKVDGVGSELVRICAACGGENPDGFRHCGHCGAALAAPAVGRRKLATLLFCDLSGSTAMGERVDPETVRELMLSYFAEAQSALEAHGGTVEKFIGDAVVAAFGVPQVHEDDALRACRAALEIQARLAAVSTDLERRYGSGIAVRIGVNTGEVVAGDSSTRQTFVTGDAVNVAARLEQAAAPGEVLLGESTHRLVRESVTVEHVEPLAAKGKSEPLAAYRLLQVTQREAVSWASPLVGRSTELELLERELDIAVAERRCRLVTVVGEPGVGKSRLAAELTERVASRARVVRGACLSYGEGITFWAVAQIVRDLAGIRDDHSPEETRATLETAMAGTPDGAVVAARIAQLLGLGEGSAPADLITQAVQRFLAAQAAERPLLVLVEDIHWAEPALLDLLAGLPAGIDDAPIAVLCLARPELIEARPDWPVTMRVEPLGAAELDTLLESLGTPADLHQRLAQASAGNPLFAEELVAWAREGGLEAGELPTSLNALLGARLDQLDPEARDTLERGAVEGELFHRGAVVELSEPASRPLVPARLEALTRQDLLRLAAASFAGEAAFRFKHILFRDAAYQGTAKKLRAVLHEQFANWLETFAGARVAEYQEILGYHLEQAYRYRIELGPADDEARALAARAATHLGAAGNRANDRGDVRASVNLLGRAIRLLPEDSRERLELLLPYGYAVSETERVRDAVAIFDELNERATALGERGLAAHGRGFDLGNTGFDAARRVARDEVQPIAEELLETFTELGDVPGMAKACRWLGLHVYRRRGQYAVAADWLERALVHANACGDLTLRRDMCQTLASTLWDGPMHVADASRRTEELGEAGRDDRVLEAVLTRALGLLAAMAGRFDEAREHDARAGRVLDEANLVVSSWIYRSTSARTKELTGDRAGAERERKASFDYFREAFGGTSGMLASNRAKSLALSCCDEGRWEEAEEWFAIWHAGQPRAAANSGIAARLAAHRGELAEALTIVQCRVEEAEATDALNTRATVQLALAEIQRAAGNTAEADVAVAYAIELFEQKGNVAAAARVRATVLDAARAK